MISFPNLRSVRNDAKGATPEAPTNHELETINEHAPLARAIAKKAPPSAVNPIGTAPHETTRTIRAQRTTPPMRKKIRSLKRTLKKEKKLHGTMCSRALLSLVLFYLISQSSSHPPSGSSVRSSSRTFLKWFCAGARGELTVTLSRMSTTSQSASLP